MVILAHMWQTPCITHAAFAYLISIKTIRKVGGNFKVSDHTQLNN